MSKTLCSKARTDFLFARPSFLTGAARVFDLGPVFDEYNRCRTGEEADAWALLNDRCIVSIEWVAAFRRLVEAEDPDLEMYIHRAPLAESSEEDESEHDLTLSPR